MVLVIHIEDNEGVLKVDFDWKGEICWRAFWATIRENQALFDHCSFLEVVIALKNLEVKEIDEVWILEFQKRLMRKKISLNYKMNCSYTISFILHTISKLKNEFLLKEGDWRKTLFGFLS